MMSSMSSDDTLSIACLLKISTGTAVSMAVLPRRRVPMTTISSISSSDSTVSCCAIALLGESATTTSMLVIRVKQAIGGFLLIATDPCPCQSNLLTIPFSVHCAMCIEKAIYTEYRRINHSFKYRNYREIKRAVVSRRGHEYAVISVAGTNVIYTRSRRHRAVDKHPPNHRHANTRPGLVQ
jgi:hypothetical protein